MKKPNTIKTTYWIEHRTYMSCSNCDEPWDYEKNQTEAFKFCPNCGAKMGKKPKDEKA